MQDKSLSKPKVYDLMIGINILIQTFRKAIHQKSTTLQTETSQSTNQSPQPRGNREIFNKESRPNHPLPSHSSLNTKIDIGGE